MAPASSIPCLTLHNPFCPWQLGLRTRSPRPPPTTPGSKPNRLAPARTRTRTRAHTRALTLTLSFTTRAHTQTRALPLCTRAHTHTRVLPRAHVCSHSQAHFHALRLPHARHTHKSSHSHSGPFTPQGRRHRRRGRREDPRSSHG